MTTTTTPSIDRIPVGPIFGGTAPNPAAQYGIQTTGDVLVDRTADGVDLNVMWEQVDRRLPDCQR